jgi:hypothetical protein
MNRNNVDPHPPWMTEDDPLADAVVQDWLRADQAHRQLLLQGMTSGVRHIPDAPQSYRAFLEHAEKALAGAPDLALATQAYLLATPLWLSIALGPGALVHTYSDPSIARTLVRTGRLLEESVARRLAETQLWNLQLFRPQAWTLGGVGYVHTLQVRLMHAKVRASLADRNHAGQSVNEIITQRQMVRTWLGFSAVGTAALERLGFEWTVEERANVAQLWTLVGHLLGIPSGCLEDLSQPHGPPSWLSGINPMQFLPSEDGTRLTHAMLSSLGKRMSVLLNLPEPVSTGLMHAFARLIHGDEVADVMGINRTEMMALAPVFVDANRYRLQQLRLDESRKQAALTQTAQDVEAICASLTGPAAYQHSA